MGTYDSSKYDIGIVKQDGESIGLMLARDPKTNAPLYEVVDDEFLAAQMFTGVPGYGNLPPEKEIAMRGDDHRSGFGLEVYDASDPKRYFASYNMDLRFRGMGIASPKATGISYPATPTTYSDVLNKGFETWSAGDPASWTVSDSDYVTEEKTIVKSGSSCKIVAKSTHATEYVEQSFTGVSEWIGHYITITAYTYIDDDTGVKARLKLYRNGDVVKTDEFTGTIRTWNLLSLKYAVPEGTTTLKIRCENYNTGAMNAPAYFDNVTLSRASAGAPVTMIEFNGKLYVALGDVLAKLNAGGTGLLGLYEFDYAITDLEAFTGDNLYIALGKDNIYYYMSTAEALTAATGDSKADFFCAVGDTMWKAIKPNSIYYAANPTAEANWSSPATTVDSTTYDILDLITNGTTLVIKKEDRTFYYTGSAIAVLIEETKHLVADTTGKNALYWQGKYYIPCGASSLIEYDDGAISWRSPDKFCTNLGDFDGQIQALAGDEEWLFAITPNTRDDTNDGTNYVEVLAGRTETIDGTTKWVWHPLCEFELTGCSCAFVSSVYQKRLWIGSTESDEDLYYIPLYASYGDVTNDDNAYFQTLGYYITPWLHGNFKGNNKAFIKLILTMEDTSSTVYFRAYYQKLGDAGWTEIEDTNQTEDETGDDVGHYFKTSPTTTGYIPVDSSVNDPVSTMIRFMFQEVCTTSATPKLLGYDCRGILSVPKRKIIRCVVKCADEMLLKDGVERESVASAIKSALEEADNATWPVTFYDIRAETKYVNFLPMRTPITHAEKGRDPEEWYYLTLQAVSLS